jgi:hypothetical protein
MQKGWCNEQMVGILETETLLGAVALCLELYFIFDVPHKYYRTMSILNNLVASIGSRTYLHMCLENKTYS